MWEICKDLQDEIVTMRRDLHQIPEIGGNLPETKAYVIKKLTEMGIPFTENKSDSGLMAEIRGGKPGKTIALRADMDALPIQEANEVEYISRHEGIMHACGHDAHTAMLLGAARVLSENKERIPGTVRLLFQTDEEGSRGAERTIKEGGIQGADAVFGTHIGTILSKDIPSGTMVCTPGCCMASFDKFVIRVKGNGCHGSTPEKGVDPINIASHIVINLQEIVAREIAATKPAVLTIGHMEAGFAYNVIPSEALIEGTIRALEEDVRQELARRIKEVAEATARTFRGEVEYEMIWGAPPVISDPEMAALAADCAREVVGESRVIDRVDAPNMGGEDFAYFLNQVPGAFMFLSSSNPEKHTDIPHHNPRFNVDEDVLWIGSAMFVKIVERFLEIE
ncbi:MAG: M20 family metallopeptidase [Lachnospiraceae bacterium]|nr:amidohydrolase [Clostridium sp. MCC334]MEE0222348.1 M20 family metallopeptidase [Lachnospiraceae bacterium]